MSHSIRALKEGSGLSPYRRWYNNWVRKNAKGKVLDVGQSTYWDYGFQTIDTNPDLKPTFLGDICNSSLPDNCYDTVLCNGMYEFVSSPQNMVYEIHRILKPGGKVIFGFVGENYPPYKSDWNFYNNNIDFWRYEILDKKDFDNEYHFIVCKKESGKSEIK